MKVTIKKYSEEIVLEGEADEVLKALTIIYPPPLNIVNVPTVWSYPTHGVPGCIYSADKG